MTAGLPYRVYACWVDGGSVVDGKPESNIPNSKDVESVLGQLLQTLDPRELEIKDENGRSQLFRVLACRTSDNRIKAMVVLPSDIDQNRSGQKHTVDGREFARTAEELHVLIAHLFKEGEDEWQRVARKLHDDVSQRLSLLEILLHEMMAEERSPADLERIEAARGHVQSLNDAVRRISHRLYPAILQDLGLPAALRAMVHEFSEGEDMPATYTSQDLPETWSPEAATALYWIAHEALRNVSKHAGKTHVKVMLTGSGDRLELRVIDFGDGFDQETEPPAPGLGMIAMQERARIAGGTLQVKSALGQGTTVTATVPLVRHG